MFYITRTIESDIKKRLFSGKAIIVYGPRQSGKTTMIKHIIRPHDKDTLWLNGDSPDIRDMLENVTVTKWKAILGSKKFIVIDEAQRITNIGLAIKLLVDELPEIQLIATGSSAFELADKTSEPLTGRKFEYHLLPLSFGEMCGKHGLLEEKRALEQRMLYGSYPEIISKPGDEQPLLSMLAGSYLYKDLLMLENIKKPQLLDKLIRAVALQIGSEVSTSELAKLTGADNKTVDKYIDLLEKSYVVFTLSAFSRNARKEIRKSRKIFFYDLGIRNAVLGNFVPVTSRTDIGGLWENYLILERIKLQYNQPFPPRCHFWRTTEQQEVDYIEESSDTLSAWKFKWKKDSKVKIPVTFTNAYPKAKTAFVTPANYDEFLLS
ncbi:MAG: ATP-binding protein [Victivallales bacterium]